MRTATQIKKLSSRKRRRLLPRRSSSKRAAAKMRRKRSLLSPKVATRRRTLTMLSLKSFMVLATRTSVAQRRLKIPTLRRTQKTRDLPRARRVLRGRLPRPKRLPLKRRTQAMRNLRKSSQNLSQSLRNRFKLPQLLSRRRKRLTIMKMASILLRLVPKLRLLQLKKAITRPERKKRSVIVRDLKKSRRRENLQLK